MSTIRQKKAAKLVVENLNSPKPLTAGEIVESSGFGVSMKKNPKVVLESKGVQVELKALGFDPETAKGVVADILMAGEEDRDRLKAADMVFKVHGTYAAEKHVNLNVEVEPSDKIRELALKLRNSLK